MTGCATCSKADSTETTPDEVEASLVGEAADARMTSRQPRKPAALTMEQKAELTIVRKAAPPLPPLRVAQP